MKMKLYFIGLLLLFSLGCEFLVNPEDFIPGNGNESSVELQIENSSNQFVSVKEFPVHDFGQIQNGQTISKSFNLKIVSEEEVTPKISLTSDYWNETHAISASSITVTITNTKYLPAGNYLGVVEILLNETKFEFAVTAFQSDTVLPPSEELFPKTLTLIDDALSFSTEKNFENYIGNDGLGWNVSGNASILTNSLVELPYQNESMAVAEYEVSDYATGFYALSFRAVEAISSGANFKFSLNKSDSTQLSMTINETSEDWTEYGILVTFENLRLYKKVGEAFSLVEKMAITTTDHSNFAIEMIQFSLNKDASQSGNGILIEKIAYYEADFTIENTPPAPLATAVTIADDSTSVNVGSNVQINASATPATALQEFYWGSSDETIATVDSNGFVTIIATDTTQVTIKATAKDGSEKSDSIIINILGNSAPITLVVDATTTLTLVEGFNFNEENAKVSLKNANVTIDTENGHLVVTNHFGHAISIDSLDTWSAVAIKLKHTDFPGNYDFNSGWQEFFTYYRPDRIGVQTSGWGEIFKLTPGWTQTANTWTTCFVYKNGNNVVFGKDSERKNGTSATALGAFGSNFNAHFRHSASGTVGTTTVDYIAFYN